MAYIKMFCFWAFLIVFSLSAEEKLKMKTFYLGLEPKNKFAIIKDMLSSDGKIFWINSHNVLVKDTSDNLNKVENFLESGDVAIKDQIRVSFKRKSQTHDQSSKFGVGLESSRSRGTKVNVRMGAEQNRQNGENTSSILGSNGEWAYLSLLEIESQLLLYRDRFIEVTAVGPVISDGVALAVRPLIAGRHVRLQVQSIYWAKVKGGKRLEYKTGDISTQVILQPGQWMSIGGGTASSTSSNRRNIIQSRNRGAFSEFTDFSVKAEVLKVQK